MEEKKYLVIDGKQTRIEDLTGREFGRLTVVDFYKVIKKHTYWNCICNCGNLQEVIVESYNLKRSHTQSCGCLWIEFNKFKKDKNFNISFENWCVENNHQDYLDLWDYELNDRTPKDVGYSTHKLYYFKCSKNMHKSELKNLYNLSNSNGIVCVQCNSFAQYGIDNICFDFLEKYWDYDKNTVSPWEILRQSNKKVWIKCQEKNYHDSYEIACNNFYNGKRCSYCAMKKIHKLDSLGSLNPKVFEVWSDKNKKTPYKIAPMSDSFHWFKCKNGIHKEYKRSVASSVSLDFRCPECSFSKGENRISELLMNNKIEYISQQEYEGLVGINNGNLSYDFKVKDILIEYQGEQHEHFVKGFHSTYADFEKQQEHDKRKREYAKEHNIKLLEIWYWDFDNVEEILKRELKIN